MEATLKILNDLEREAVISRYAIGGAVGAIFYMEPFLTYDLDVFVLLPQTTGGAPATDGRADPAPAGEIRSLLETGGTERSMITMHPEILSKDG